MFGVTKVNVYPVPVFDYQSNMMKNIWCVDVRFKKGGISTEYNNVSTRPSADAGSEGKLERLKDADEAEKVGREIAARLNCKRIQVRRWVSYEKYLNRWIS